MSRDFRSMEVVYRALWWLALAGLVILTAVAVWLVVLL